MVSRRARPAPGGEPRPGMARVRYG